jgi:hypothetical protein
MELSSLDQKQFYSHLYNKSFYIKCPDDPNYYRTVYIKHNIFTNNPQVLTSNAVFGSPPEGMNEMNPMMYSRLQRQSFLSPPPY